MNEKIEKMIKKDKITMTIAYACIAILIGSICWMVQISNSKPIQLLDADKEGQGAYVNTVTVPYGFAARNAQREWLAILADENNYLYIVQLTNAQFSTIKNYFEIKGEDAKPFEIAGKTKTIDANIKSLALETYNEIVSEEKQIAEEDFYKYFGELYVVMGPTEDYSIPALVATISSIIALSLLIVGLKSKNKTKKTMDSESYQKAIEESNNPEFESKQAILTKNYVIYYNCGLNIISYNDISWVYRHTVRYNGVPSHAVAYYVIGSKKVNLIGCGMNQKLADSLVVYIAKKNSKILVGYTNENRRAHKERI